MFAQWRLPFCGKRAASRIGPFGLFLILVFVFPAQGLAKIYIDINAPSLRKFNVAIPDFRNLNKNGENPELASRLAEVISRDLDLSGYFSPLDKGAFLEERGTSQSPEEIRFRDWAVIGAELLVKGAYTCVGSRVEVEVRIYDVFWSRQILGKIVLGERSSYRHLMHRLSNEIILALTGYQGIFLTKLAFVSTTTGHKEIYISDYDGENARQITDDQSIALLPRWSPAGDRILFTSYKDGGPMLYMWEAATRSVRKISARRGLNMGGAWSPDGRRLALTLSLNENPDVFLTDLNGRIIKQVTRTWGINVSPVFSPDGKEMAFVSNRSGSPQIYILNLASGTEKRLTFDGNYNTSPSWSSQNRIIYTSMQGGAFDIYSIDPEEGRPRRLTEHPANDEDPCFSPDGKYIAFSSNREGAYHLYLMNENGQNQRKIGFMKGEQTAPNWGP